MCSVASCKSTPEEVQVNEQESRVAREQHQIAGFVSLEGYDELQWKHGSKISLISNILTFQSIFLYGKLSGHLPVYGWLCIAATFIKQIANAVMILLGKTPWSFKC